MDHQRTKDAPPIAAPHPATRAWCKLTQHQAIPESVEILQECVRKPEIYRQTSKPSIYRLFGVGPGRANVIAKRSESAAASTECLIYEKVLPHLPVSTLAFYGFVSEEDPQFCWLFLEDAGEADYSLDLEEHRILAGHWLGVVNVSAQRLPAVARLPDRGPGFYLERLLQSRDTIREILRKSIFNNDDLAVLRVVISHCDALERRWDHVERFCSRMPRTLVHGDFADQNARLRIGPRGDSLLVIDWEGAGCGPPAVDLAQFVGFSLSPDLRAYHSVVRLSWPGLELAEIESLAELGRMFRLIHSLEWANWGYGAAVAVADWYMEEMRWCERELADWLRAAETRDK
jgi:hypothetical protein